MKHILSPLTLRDAAITVFVLLAATILCIFLRIVDSDVNNISTIFILAVFLISRFTDGYICGIVSSLFSVMAVNYIFTYPYFQFDFTLSGYPLTTLCMLSVSLITSALTTQIKEHGDMRVAAEKEKTRSNLLRAVSHDLRTPLTSILGASSAIMENDDLLTKEERIKLVSEIKEDSQWLIRMVENLLTITRIDGEDSAKIVKKPEPVEELIPDAVVKFKKRFPDFPVEVQIPDSFLMVPMDAILIEQVLINLMENAVLHGKGATGVSLVVEKGEDIVTFSVTDDGSGIDEKRLPHLFDGYLKSAYEEEGDTKKNMGIGLSVCYTIIQAHSGNMSARNLPAGGAEFRFTLPLKEE